MGRRMTLPKDEESMMKIQEEIHGAHEHHHHHHHHGDLEEILIYILETLQDLKERVRRCEQNLDGVQSDVRVLYKTVVFLLRAMITEGEEKKESLEEALKALERKV